MKLLIAVVLLVTVAAVCADKPHKHKKRQDLQHEFSNHVHGHPHDKKFWKKKYKYNKHQHMMTPQEMKTMMGSYYHKGMELGDMPYHMMSDLKVKKGKGKHHKKDHHKYKGEHKQQQLLGHRGEHWAANPNRHNEKLLGHRGEHWAAAKKVHKQPLLGHRGEHWAKEEKQPLLGHRGEHWAREGKKGEFWPDAEKDMHLQDLTYEEPVQENKPEVSEEPPKPEKLKPKKNKVNEKTHIIQEPKEQKLQHITNTAPKVSSFTEEKPKKHHKKQHYKKMKNQNKDQHYKWEKHEKKKNRN